MNEIAMPGNNEPVDGSLPTRPATGAGVDGPSVPASHATGHAEVRLSPSQLKLYKRLCDIDGKLARMYEGGLRVLQDADNPDRIPQSAHSIREITHHLSNRAKGMLTKDEEREAAKDQSSNARQLEKLFDPLGGVPHLNSSVYDRWNREFHRHFVDVSHHRCDVTWEGYCSKLAQYENFLLAYVLPLQTEVYARLDERLRDGPATAKPDELKLLLSRNLESYRYFFRNADSRWLPFLRENGLLAQVADSAEYLSRIAANDNSEAVMGVIEPMATSTEDWAARKGLLEAAAKMPPIVSRRIIPKLRREQWLETPYRDWITHLATGLFRQLVGGGYHFEGLKLAAMVIEAGTRESEAKEYYLKEFLVCLEDVPAEELPPFIRVLVNGLGSAIQVEEQHDGSEDASIIWRPAIEDHEQNADYGRLKCLLVVFLRDLLDRYADYSNQVQCENAEHVFDGLLQFEKPYSIFARLRLHLFRKHGDLFTEAAERAAIEYFHQSNTWHEYALLLRERFGLFSGATRQKWLSLLDSGPGGEQHRDDVKEWKAYRLAVVAHHLDPNEKEPYRALLDTAASVPHPDFQIFHGGVQIGPTSPTTSEELATMSVEAIVEHLEAWEPSGDWFAPSREGLGRDLASAVTKRAELFSREALRFFSPRIRPVYVYHLLSGLYEAHRSNAGLDWAGILALLDQLIHHAELGELPAFDPTTADEHEWEYTWTAPLRASITLVQSGLESNSWRWEDRGRLWRIICFLCEHPDPSPE